MKAEPEKLYVEMAAIYVEREGIALRAELAKMALSADAEKAQSAPPPRLGGGLDKKLRKGLFLLKYRVHIPRIVGGGLAAAACLAMAVLLPQIFSQPQVGGEALQLAADSAPAEAAPFAAQSRMGGELAESFDFEGDAGAAPIAIMEENLFGLDGENDSFSPSLGGGGDSVEYPLPHDEVSPIWEPESFAAGPDNAGEQPLAGGALPDLRDGRALPGEAAAIDPHRAEPVGEIRPINFALPDGFYQVEGFHQNGSYVFRFAHQDFEHTYINLHIRPIAAGYSVDWPRDDAFSATLGGVTVDYWIDQRGYGLLFYFVANDVFYQIDSGFDSDTTLVFAQAVIQG